MGIVVGSILAFLGVIVVVFSRRISKLYDKIYPDYLLPLVTAIGLPLTIAVGVAWALIGIYLILNVLGVVSVGKGGLW